MRIVFFWVLNCAWLILRHHCQRWHSVVGRRRSKHTCTHCTLIENPQQSSEAQTGRQDGGSPPGSTTLLKMGFVFAIHFKGNLVIVDFLSEIFQSKCEDVNTPQCFLSACVLSVDGSVGTLLSILCSLTEKLQNEGPLMDECGQHSCFSVTSDPSRLSVCSRFSNQTRPLTHTDA